MLETRNLGFSYNRQLSFRFPDITCPSGTTVLITGASGKGKTTLLHLLAGILTPSEGEIKIDTIDITALQGKALDSFRGKKIGIIFQQSHFVQSLTVYENILLASYLSGNKKDHRKAMDLMMQLNIADQAHKKTAALSQGQKQRVSIARAMMNNPGVILADEPTSSLDDEHCFKVAELLSSQAQRANAALVIVTHDKRLKDLFNRIIELT